MTVTFVTGNQGKADYFAKCIGMPVHRASVDLDEIQTLDMREVARHKAEQAYAKLGVPVVVDDTGIEFEALGRLPGTFCKFFIEELGMEGLCCLLDGYDTRNVTVRSVFEYCDEHGVELFENTTPGTLTKRPVGTTAGFGFDSIFIPEGYTVTRGELSPEDDIKTYTAIKPFAALRAFLETR